MNDHPNQTIGTETKPSNNTPLALGAAIKRRGVVLLADDEPAMLSMFKRTLEKSGFRVLLAVDGQEALEVFREHADEIDGVLLDCSMPRMTGIEAFEAIRNVRSDVPVILSSGFSREESGADICDCGPSSFLQKPFSPQTLLETLQQSLLG